MCVNLKQTNKIPEEGEKAEVRGDGEEVMAVAEGGEGRGLLIDRSTGSVWKRWWPWARRSSGGSGLTLLSRRGTVSIAG